MNEMTSIAMIFISAFVLGPTTGEPPINKGTFTRPTSVASSNYVQHPLNPFDSDMLTQKVAVAVLAGLGVLGGGAALSALSAQNQLQSLQGNFRTVCNAIRAAGSVDGRRVPPVGPPGPPGPIGPPGPSGMDGTCSATGNSDNCAEAQADISDVIARLREVSASTCNF